jgi:hypothetical protein
MIIFISAWSCKKDKEVEKILGIIPTAADLLFLPGQTSPRAPWMRKRLKEKSCSLSA